MKTVFSVLLICCFFTSCDWGSKEEPGFYEHSRYSDLYRIPLVSPYEVISADRGTTWTMEFRGNFSTGLGSGDIDSVGINDSCFILYAPRTYFDYKMTEVWFVVNSSKKVEKGFSTYNDLNEYLQRQELGEINLYSVHDIFRAFDKKKNLPKEWSHLIN